MGILLRRRTVRLLIFGQLTSSFATTAIQFALSLYVLDRTGSAVIFANILACSLIAKIGFTAIIGGVIDRYDKKWLMVCLDASYMLCTIVFILLLDTAPLILTVLTYNLVVSAIASLETPLVQATSPLIAEPENLLALNGLINQSSVLSTIVAPLVVGAIHQANNLKLILFTGVGMFIAAVVAECCLNFDDVKNETEEALTHQFRQTCLDLLTTQKVVGRLALFAGGINLLITALIEVGVPIIFRLGLQLTSFAYGSVQAALAVSALLGAMCASIVSRKLNARQFSWIIILSPLPMAGIAILFATSINRIFSAFLLTGSFMIIQFAFTMVSVRLLSQIQRRVAPERLGRIMSVVMLVVMISLPIGQSLYGWLFGFLDTNSQLGLLLFVTAFMAMLLSWRFRRLLIL